MFLILALLFFVQNPEAPFKAEGDFDVTIDVQIRPRPFTPEDNDAKLNENGKVVRKKPESLPYLGLNIKLLKLSEREVKAKVFNKSGSSIYNKKVLEGGSIHLNPGFITDIKQGLVSNQFTVIFFDVDKKPFSRIHIMINGDGTFWVNNVQRGMF